MAKIDAAERSFRFHYSTTIREDQSKDGAVAVWIPLPQTTEHQIIGPIEIESPFPWADNVEAKLGNRMAYVEVPKGSPATKIVAHYDVRRKRMHVAAPDASVDYGKDDDPKQHAKYLRPNANLPVDGYIADQARAVTNHSDRPAVRARKLYDYLLTTLEYDWAGCTPDRLHELGNLAQACDLRKGTCTEFHGLYIGYARAMGIPAKFFFGFNIPDDKEESAVGGYHCWSEIWLPRVGWFPVVVSEAVKARAKNQGQEAVDFFFGGMDANRFQLTNGRDVALEPRQPGGLIDKFIFSRAFRGEESIEPDLWFSMSKAKEL